MTRQQMTAAQWAQEKVRRGIDPEDYEAFDAGKMIGYDGDGNWIPGPSYVPNEDDEEEIDEDDSEASDEDDSAQTAPAVANKANAVESSPSETVAPVASETPPADDLASDAITATNATAAATAAPAVEQPQT
jgi:hypothetical protein